ncbi:hypothetical protein LEMLEM_LOCUS17639 [Lemmus lemmus]
MVVSDLVVLVEPESFASAASVLNYRVIPPDPNVIFGVSCPAESALWIC